MMDLTFAYFSTKWSHDYCIFFLICVKHGPTLLTYCQMDIALYLKQQNIT